MLSQTLCAFRMKRSLEVQRYMHHRHCSQLAYHELLEMEAQDQPPLKRLRGRPSRDEALLRNVLTSRGLLPSAPSLLTIRCLSPQLLQTLLDRSSHSGGTPRGLLVEQDSVTSFGGFTRIPFCDGCGGGRFVFNSKVYAAFASDKVAVKLAFRFHRPPSASSDYSAAAKAACCWRLSSKVAAASG